jgi:hypothetical protein
MVMGNRVTGRGRADIEFEVDEQDRALRRLDAVMDRFRIAEGRSDRASSKARTCACRWTAVDAHGELREIRDAFAAHVVFEDARVPDLRVTTATCRSVRCASRVARVC